MPLALVRYNVNRVSKAEARYIARKLPQLVARRLSVPGTQGVLTRADVEVWVSTASPLDANVKDLAIVVFAGLYPERLASLDERRQMLSNDIRCLFTKQWTGFLWIVLQPQSFGEW